MGGLQTKYLSAGPLAEERAGMSSPHLSHCWWSRVEGEEWRARAVIVPCLACVVVLREPYCFGNLTIRACASPLIWAWRIGYQKFAVGETLAPQRVHLQEQSLCSRAV